MKKILILIVLNCAILDTNNLVLATSTTKFYNSSWLFARVARDGESEVRNVKLMLIGMVYDRITQQPIASAKVELVDNVTRAKQSYTTNKDGRFYFKLIEDRNYQLNALNSRGGIEDTRTISTVNKHEPEIMHAVLQSISDIKESRPEVANFETRKSPETAGAGTMTANNDLVFKVQVGAFKDKQGSQSPFMRGLGNIKVQPEDMSNGFVRYMAGEFKYLKDAQNLERLLKQQNYNKAFIVPYYKNERLKITPEEAEKIYRSGGR